MKEHMPGLLVSVIGFFFLDSFPSHPVQLMQMNAYVGEWWTTIPRSEATPAS